MELSAFHERETGRRTEEGRFHVRQARQSANGLSTPLVVRDAVHTVRSKLVGMLWEWTEVVLTVETLAEREAELALC